MSTNTEVSLQEQEDRQKMTVERYMNGKAGLEQFVGELRAVGLTDLPDNIWASPNVKRSNVEAAVHSTFNVLGGVPAMALWAHKNPNLFYPAYIKLAPTESTITGAGNVIIHTAVPESPLDVVEIDSFGQVKR